MNWCPQPLLDLPNEGQIATLEIRTVIADDDPASRRRLRAMLESEPGVQVFAECTNGGEAVGAVQQHKPDLLVLDAGLPDMDAAPSLGFIPPSERPLLIFTGANHGDAARAFEAQALDYLLKPFDQQRLHSALSRTRAEISKAEDHNLARRLLKVLETGNSESPMDKRLVVKSEGRVIFLKMDEIDWIEAAANYVRLQAGSQCYLLREGISHIAARLDPQQFLRIHRSIIVNVNRIKELQPCNRGEYMVILTNGKELSCSRGYRAHLQQLIAGT